ncbi:hypothetical protein RMATCC62417_16893 [Rhizopus microsporus]|nr:hypothetical protein RMATCC62417_16893 [Rhizopus microsporus]
MKGKNKQTTTSPQQKESPKNVVEDKYENVIEENSDDDFQPTITRKRKSREPTPVNSSQKRMKKGKEKSSSSTSTAIVESKSSGDAPLTKSTVATAKHNAVSDSNNSSANANTVKKRVIAVKTTVKSIWNPNYTQALHELVNITNTLVTHMFAFSQYIFLKELEEDFNFDLSDYIRKEFFVEVFLSLIKCKLYTNRASECSTLQTKQAYFSNHCFDFHLKNKADLYFGHLFVARIRGYFPQSDESTSIDTHATYLELMIKQRYISERLDNDDKTKLLEIVAKMSKESSDQDSLKQQAGQILKKLQVLPFRKMKFSSKLYYDQDDLMLVKKLKQKFGSDAVLVLERRLSVLYVRLGWRTLKQYAIQDPTRERLGLLYFAMDYNGKDYDNARYYEISNHNSYWAIRCTNSGCLELKPKLWNP